MAKDLNTVNVHGENVVVRYEKGLGRLFRSIHDINFRNAFIVNAILCPFFLLMFMFKMDYILILILGLLSYYFFSYIKLKYKPVLADLAKIGVHFDNKKDKYFLHMGDAVRAISEIPKPGDVKKLTPEKIQYPVLISVDMALRHMYVVGTTGSGKTTLLIWMLKQQLESGGGIMVVDGKGDKDIYTDITNATVHTYREDDMAVINFNVPTESNKFNPLLKGDSGSVTDILGGMLETGGENAMWSGRAMDMMSGLLKSLTVLRDNDELYDPFKMPLEDVGKKGGNPKIDYVVPRKRTNGDFSGEGYYQPILTFKVLTKFTDLTSMRDLYFRMLDRNRKMKSEGKLDQIVDVDGLGKYLISCNTQIREEERWADIPERGAQMHSNSNVMWGEALNVFAQQFGAIFNTSEPDIDMQDIVSNGRVLYVLLPATKKDPRTLEILGKVILTLAKQAIATLLGDKISGSIEERAASSAIKPSIPFMLVCDEFGAYAVEGFDNVLAQARSLSVSVVLMVQESASLEKSGEREKKRLLGNTAIKVALKVEEEATAKELSEFVGTKQMAFVKRTTEKGNEQGRSIEIQDKEILKANELKKMKGGHGYLIFSGEIVPMLCGYYKPPNSAYIQEFNKFSEVSVQLYQVQNYYESYNKDGGVFSDYSLFKNKKETKHQTYVMQADINSSNKTFRTLAIQQKRMDDIDNYKTSNAKSDISPQNVAVNISSYFVEDLKNAS